MDNHAHPANVPELCALMSQGLQAILASGDREQIFLRLHAVLQQLLPVEHALLLELRHHRWCLLRSSQRPLSFTSLAADSICAAAPAQPRIVATSELWWQQYFQHLFPSTNSVLLQPVSTADNRYLLLLMADAPQQFDASHLPILQAFASFIASAMTMMEQHKLIRQRDELLLHQQRIERQLQQQDKMASLGQLAAGVAHELNNPLAYISSNLNTLKRYLQDLSALVHQLQQQHPQITPQLNSCDSAYWLQDGQELLDESLEGCRRAGEIIRSLGSFSSTSVPVTAALNVEELLQSTLKQLPSELLQQVELEWQLHAPHHAVMACYPQLQQAIRNLLLNALQAVTSRAHGHVCLRTELSAEWLVLTISDNGCGIAPEHLPKIFEPFFTTRDVGQGAGLGLAVSKAIVEQHGGRISISSNPQGSRVEVMLPRLLLKETDSPGKPQADNLLFNSDD